MLRIFAFVLVATLASVGATNYDTCAGSDPSPLSVDVEGCAAQPCDFTRGDQIEADVKFEIDHDISKLTAEVKATVLGITVNYPLPEPNACNSITNSECPLYAGENINYHLSMPVLQSYPKVDFLVQLSLLDQNNKAVACFKINGKITD